MNKIVVIGSINADLVFSSDRRPLAGETVTGNEFKTVPGGKGANQAVAAAKLGADVTMIGCVGSDINGSFSVDNLKRMNVDTNSIKTVDNSTGVACITLADNDNSIIVIPGANSNLSVSVVDEYKSAILQSDLVLLQLEIPIETVSYVVNLCNENNIATVLNPAPAVKIDEDLLNKISFITPNEHEVRIIFGLEENVDIVDTIKKYPNKLLITLGEKGVMYYDGKDIITVPAEQADVVDTTGAGDTFNGAFARAIVNEFKIYDAIKFANKAAAKSVTKFGAQGGMPYLNELQN